MVVHRDMSHEAAAESRALARLTFEELGRGPAGIWAIHRAIAQRAFRAVGPTARAVEVTHNAVAGAVYGGLVNATSALGRGAAEAAARRAALAPALSTTPRGAAVLAAVNGLIGDVL